MTNSVTIKTLPDGTKLVDYYGDFWRGPAKCACGWSGRGADLISGESFGDGVDKDCPACAETWGFVQYSVTVAPTH